MQSILIAQPLMSPTLMSKVEYLQYLSSDQFNIIMSSDHIEIIREYLELFNIKHFSDKYIEDDSDIDHYIDTIQKELDKLISLANNDTLFPAYFWIDAISAVEIDKGYCRIVKSINDNLYEAKLREITEQCIYQWSQENIDFYNLQEILFIVDMSIIARGQPFVLLQPGQY